MLIVLIRRIHCLVIATSLLDIFVVLVVKVITKGQIADFEMLLVIDVHVKVTFHQFVSLSLQDVQYIILISLMDPRYAPGSNINYYTRQ